MNTCLISTRIHRVFCSIITDMVLTGHLYIYIVSNLPIEVKLFFICSRYSA